MNSILSSFSFSMFAVIHSLTSPIHVSSLCMQLSLSPLFASLKERYIC